MPETARILQFPSRAQSAELSRAEVMRQARAYLDAVPEKRTAIAAGVLGDADVLLELCALLRNEANTAPASVADEACQIYRWLLAQPPSVGLFDERDFFLGESAFIAGGTYRLLGLREDTERWLDRAEAGFRHTLNPAPLLARVAYVRLALRFDMRKYDDVLELLPSIELTFQKHGMYQELAKCQFLEAVTLKDLGRDQEAILKLESLVIDSRTRCDASICGMALVNLGDLRSRQSQFDLALKSYTDALPLLQNTKRLFALADLKCMVGDTLRRMGRLAASLDAYRGAVQDCLELGATTRVAYFRILLSEALLEAGRAKEAEWEIRAALPTIEAQKMVPEGFAAIGLLNEAIRQRRTDPKALLELREYLQAKN